MSTIAGPIPVGSGQLQSLRDLILQTPDHAPRILETRLEVTEQVAERVDLLILLAETLSWRNELPAALQLSREASEAAMLLDGDPHRRTLSVGLGADLALRAARLDAPDVCIAFVHAVAGEQPFHWNRYVVASALHAISVYHHQDRLAGSRALSTLINKVEGGTCLSAALAAAYTAMADRPIPGGVRLAGLVPPLPGLLLAPDLSAEVTTVSQAEIVQAFTSRVRMHPAAHSRSRR